MPRLELTDRFCSSAKPVDGKQTDYFDDTVKGLCLRVSPAGTKTWNLIYTKPADGKRARMKLGTYPDIPLGGDGGARQKARDARAGIHDGHDPAAEKRALEASQTVSELVERYIERHASRKKSAAHIARRLRRDVSDIIGAVKLSELHRRDLQKCVDKVVDRGSPIGANRTFSAIRALIRWAVSRGDLDHNLVDGMKRPTTDEEPRIRYLTADQPDADRGYPAHEIRTVWGALPKADMRESTRNTVRLCLVIGQRVGEVSGMTRDELDLGTKVWVIPGARTKNGEQHKVPLSDMAVDIIKEQLAAVDALAKRKGREPSPWVFPGPGARGPISGPAVARAVKRQEKREDKPTHIASVSICGVAPWTCHDLRRTMATHMEGMGISPFVIGCVLNHISATKATITSSVYTQYDYMKEKREALDLWADRLAGLVDVEHVDMAEVVPFKRPA